jgi:hypothetical protein
MKLVEQLLTLVTRTHALYEKALCSFDNEGFCDPGFQGFFSNWLQFISLTQICCQSDRFLETPLLFEIGDTYRGIHSA